MSLRFHQTTPTAGLFLLLWGVLAPCVPTPRVLLTSLPPRGVCVCLCSNPPLSCVHICGPDAFAFQELLCFGVSSRFGNQLLANPSCAGAGLALALQCQAPQGFTTSQNPQTVPCQPSWKLPEHRNSHDRHLLLIPFTSFQK